MTNKLPYIITITNSPDANHTIAWCRDQFGQPNKWNEAITSWKCIELPGNVVEYYFMSKDDYLLFKLAWI